MGPVASSAASLFAAQNSTDRVGNAAGIVGAGPNVTVRQASVEYVPVLKTEGDSPNSGSSGFMGGIVGQIFAGVAAGLILASFTK